MRIQEGHFLKIALNLDLTLSDDGECRTFFDSPWNHWFRCILRRVMVIIRQQKNFGPNVIYFVLRVDSWVSLPRGKNPWKQHLRIQEGHFLKSALNLDLTRSNARSRREDFDCIFFIHVGLSASSYGHFTARKEFRSQCKVLCLWISWKTIYKT